MSTHGVTLVPCTAESCKVSFLTQGEMERHLRDHMPVSCPAEDFKDRSDNLLGHRLNEGKQTSRSWLYVTLTMLHCTNLGSLYIDI